MNRTVTTVSWFSAGVSSAVATWMMRNQLDHIIYTHIDDQEADTMRFVRECEEWFGKPVTVLQSPYKCVRNAVFAGGSRFINSPSGAICTRYLKRRVRTEWESDNQWFNTFRYVWGMDVTETQPRPPRGISRVEALRLAMPQAEHVFPLVEAGMTKEMAHGVLEKAGIKRPRMYELGYRNNNCVGCVKGGMAYWNKIRVDFPGVFADRARLERECGASCINGVYLDELSPEAGRDQPPVVPECGAMCEAVVGAAAGAGGREGEGK